jgi:hypothetical protein
MHAWFAVMLAAPWVFHVRWCKMMVYANFNYTAAVVVRSTVLQPLLTMHVSW